MTSTAYTNLSRSLTVTRLAPLLGTWLVRAAGFVRAIAHRRDVAKLLELDERGLKDIGLLRNDVIGALSGPLAKDPSVILMVRSVERRARLRAAAVNPAAKRPVVPLRAVATCEGRDL